MDLTARLAAITTVCLTLGFGASASARDLFLSTVAWRSAPARTDVDAVYPPKEIGQGLAKLHCELLADGSIGVCSSVRDNNDALVGSAAFDKAARSLTAKFRAFFPAGSPLAKGDRLFCDIYFVFDDPRATAKPIELTTPEFLLHAGESGDQGVFPPAAVKAGLKSGLGTVECDGVGDGRLRNCFTVKETPAAMGFGDQALVIAPTLHLNPWQNGHAIEGARLRVPIYVDAPGAADDPRFTRQAVFHVAVGWQGTAGPYYPLDAYIARATGSVTLECVLAPSGALSDCVSIVEAPKGRGFADAALQMAERGNITARPATGADGKSSAGEVVRVDVPFKF